jgi:hypothetical protein
LVVFNSIVGFVNTGTNKLRRNEEFIAPGMRPEIFASASGRGQEYSHEERPKIVASASGRGQ